MTQCQPITMHSVSSLIGWSDGILVQYLGGDESLPYVERGGYFYYFALTGKDYVLSMWSERNLGQEQE